MSLKETQLKVFKAVEEANKAFSKLPNMWNIHIHLGKIEMNKEDRTKAVGDYRKDVLREIGEKYGLTVGFLKKILDLRPDFLNNKDDDSTADRDLYLANFRTEQFN